MSVLASGVPSGAVTEKFWVELASANLILVFLLIGFIALRWWLRKNQPEIWASAKKVFVWSGIGLVVVVACIISAIALDKYVPLPHAFPRSLKPWVASFLAGSVWMLVVYGLTAWLAARAVKRSKRAEARAEAERKARTERENAENAERRQRAEAQRAAQAELAALPQVAEAKLTPEEIEQYRRTEGGRLYLRENGIE